MKHTPGPWELFESTKYSKSLFSHDGAFIASIDGGKPGEVSIDEMQANSRLIAAAPDLVWALERMLREHDALQMATGKTGDRWEAATYARATLAKAKGE